MKFEESDTVELKTCYVEDLRKEIIAFANTNGGTIYIGVADDGGVIGLSDMDGTIQKIANSCRDTIRPDVSMFLKYEKLEIEEKAVLKLTVQRGTARPYYFHAKGLRPEGVYVRQGTSSAPASDVSIRRMIRETDGERFESIRSLEQTLTFESLRYEFEIRSIALGTPQMKTLELINADGIYTNLALLLSDQCPHTIKCAVFSGTDRSEFQDRREFSGSLLKQLNEVYEYLDYRNQTHAGYQGLLRIDSRDYPELALREALLNAVTHRDYGYSASTLISLYEDRIELVSYGGLAGNVTLEDVKLGLSVCRNPKLANVFYRMKLIEVYGTGIPKIYRAYAGKPVQPEFLASPGAFKVILPNLNHTSAEQTASESGREQEVYHWIQEHGPVSRKELEQSLGTSAPTMVRCLRSLRGQGRIRTFGSGKNVRYGV